MEILSVKHDSRKVIIRLISKGIMKDLIFKIGYDPQEFQRDQLFLDSVDIDGDFCLDDDFHQRH